MTIKELFQPGQATMRDVRMAFRAAAVCGVITAAFATAECSRADTITIGVWDNANPSAGVVQLAQYTSPTFTMQGQLGSNFAGVVSTSIFTDASGSVYREGAFNNVSAAGPGTIRLYIDFQGVTAGSLPERFGATFPTIFQAGESALPGFVVADQIFLCSNMLFCDNYVVGGGALIGEQIWSGTTGTLFPTFSAVAPGNPFSIDEVFTIAFNGVGPTGDVSGATLVQPDAVSVPGPIVGTGLPGIIAALFLIITRRGATRLGVARRGTAWRGQARHGLAVQGVAKLGLAWRGKARLRSAWQAKARCGSARRGLAWQG